MKSICWIVCMAVLASGAWSQESVWTYTPPAGHIDVSPGIGDLNGDDNIEIVVGTTAGLAVALNGKGTEIWRQETGASICIPPSVADVTGDATPEVVVMNRQGRVLCLNGRTGDIVWDTALPAPPEWGTTALAIGDLDGDGVPEIVTGNKEGAVVCLRGSGEQAWVYQSNLGKVFCPAIADVNKDGQAEVLVGSEKVSLVCLGATGKELWRVDQGPGGSPVVCDLPGIGTPAILTGIGKSLTVLDVTGKTLWSCPMKGEIDSAITVADANGDGTIEIYAADLMGNLACVSPKGDIQWNANVQERVRRSPSVGDADGDGTMEILVAGYSGAVHVFDPQGHLKVRIPLPGTSNSTATLATLSDIGLCVIVPVAAAPMQVFHWKEATRNAKVAWPEYRFDAQRTGALLSTVKKPRVESKSNFDETNYLKDVSDAEKMIAAVRTRLPKLLDTDGIKQQAVYTGVKLEELRSRIATIGTSSDTDRVAFRESLKEILREARALEKLSAMAEVAAGEGCTTVVRATNPWSPFGGIGDLAKSDSTQKELTVFVFGGETESAALNVFNFSNRSRSYRMEFEPLVQGNQSLPAQQAVKLFEVLDVPTERCDMSADALAGLNAANILQVPAWSARQLWLNVNSHALAPGEWKGRVVLRSLDITPIETRVPLTVNVWEGHLPDNQPLRHCGWGYVESSRLKDHPEEALKDQVEHGTNVFVATDVPKARFDADGNLVNEMNFTEHDAYVKRYAPHGIILFCGYQGALEGPADAKSETYRKAHVQWLRTWVKHLADLGVGYEGFALYPVDEPGLKNGLVAAYLDMAKLAREADPKIQMYTDPVAGITTDELRSMLPYVDIWCPNRSGLILDKTNVEKLDVIKQSGKSVWMYECDDNAKHLSPLGYYRGQSWLAWQHGLTGIGFWSYCTSQDDPWFIPGARYDYLLIYPGNGVVKSKRWEALRDGIEDFSMLTVLRQAIESKGSSAKPEDLKAAKQVLEEQAAVIAGFCIVDNDNVLPLGTDEMAIRSSMEDRQWAEVQHIRKEMARLLDTL